MVAAYIRMENEMEDQTQMKAEFETRVTEKDLMNFKIFHNYHSFGGVMGLLFGIVAFVIFVLTVSNNQVNISYKLMMLFFCGMFTIYTPISMKLKVKQQMKLVKAFQEPVKYTVTEEKMVLSQGEVFEDLLWDDIYKIKFTGKSIVLYLTAVRANVIPIGCLGDQLEPFMDIAEKKLKPFQIKVDMEKAKKAAKRA